MSFNFNIAETNNFNRIIKKLKLEKIYEKINKIVYPQLKNNPFFGSNIKKLKGNLDGLYRFRIGKYRLFYTVSEKEIIVFILNIKLRKDAYNK